MIDVVYMQLGKCLLRVERHVTYIYLLKTKLVTAKQLSKKQSKLAAIIK